LPKEFKLKSKTYLMDGL